MAEEKIAPVQKKVPSSGVPENKEHSTLTTPKQLIDGETPWTHAKEGSEKIM